MVQSASAVLAVLWFGSFAWSLRGLWSEARTEAQSGRRLGNHLQRARAGLRILLDGVLLPFLPLKAILGPTIEEWLSALGEGASKFIIRAQDAQGFAGRVAKVAGILALSALATVLLGKGFLLFLLLVWTLSIPGSIASLLVTAVFGVKRELTYEQLVLQTDAIIAYKACRSDGEHRALAAIPDRCFADLSIIGCPYCELHGIFAVPGTTWCYCSQCHARFTNSAPVPLTTWP